MFCKSARLWKLNVFVHNVGVTVLTRGNKMDEKMIFGYSVYGNSIDVHVRLYLGNWTCMCLCKWVFIVHLLMYSV